MLFTCEIKNETTLDLVIARTGVWLGHSAGELIITQENLQQIKTNFDARKIDCVIDYEHQSLEAGENPAAGWVKALRIEDDCVIGTISWNTKAKEMIKAGEYKYLSPTFINPYIDPITGQKKGMFLHSIALTNTPFLDCIDEARANSLNQKKGEEEMDLKQKLEELQKENKALKEQITAQNEKFACSAVESALLACKITQNQKEWALKYAKKDLEGFNQFLNTLSQTQAQFQNNIFANSTKEQQSIDVVKMALED